jgi:hypothetical protein
LLSAQPVPRGSSRQSAPGTAGPAQAALPRALAQTLGTAVPRAHLALVTGSSTTDGVNCGPHSCAESHAESSRHRRALCREPVGGSRHRSAVRGPLAGVGPTSLPRALWPALGTELTSGPAFGSCAESWARVLSAQSSSGQPGSPSVPRAKAIALGTEPALPRARALALGTDCFFFPESLWLPSSLIHHHRQLIFIAGS